MRLGSRKSKCEIRRESIDNQQLTTNNQRPTTHNKRL